MPIETAYGFEDLEDTVRTLFDSLESHAPESDEYAQIVDQIVKLTKVRQVLSEITLKTFEATAKVDDSKNAIVVREAELQLKIKEANKPDRVKADTWAMVAANIVGIGMIIGHERMHVITTKALGFILRSR